MKKKKKKSHWTTKNTHLKRYKNKEPENSSISRFDRIAIIVTIIAAILFIILKAIDNRVVGYDHYPNIPTEWIRWLK